MNRSFPAQEISVVDASLLSFKTRIITVPLGGFSYDIGIH